VKWFRKAADQGDAGAQSHLGVAYENGYGVPEDDIEALKWYRKAAGQGDADAQFNLGMMYAKGYGDGAEAVKWFRKAAGQGNAAGQYGLGMMYVKGEGIPKDSAEAVEWYRKAANQGYATAQLNLGIMYAKGEGTQKDGAEAVRWYRKAADQGCDDAQALLAKMYAEGNGVPKDDIEAMAWYNIAAASGNFSPGRIETRLSFVLAATRRWWLNSGAKRFSKELKQPRPDEVFFVRSIPSIPAGPPRYAFSGYRIAAGPSAEYFSSRIETQSTMTGSPLGLRGVSSLGFTFVATSKPEAASLRASFSDDALTTTSGSILAVLWIGVSFHILLCIVGSALRSGSGLGST